MPEVAADDAWLKAQMVRGMLGDQRATQALVQALRRPLRRFFARRLFAGGDDVDDLVQETLLAIHRRRDSFDVTQDFKAWCFAIARNKLIDHLRRKARERTQPLGDHAMTSPGEEVEQRLIQADLARLLAALTPRQRDILLDVRVQGFTMAEAAQRHGTTEGAAKVCVHRSLKRLAVSPD